MYKLVAIDLDGTLLKGDNTISGKTQKAIKAAKKKGIKIILSSGRPIEGIERYLNELKLTGEDDYVISFNGSLVQCVKDKKIISRKVLKGSDLIYLYNISVQIGVNIHAFSQIGCITPKISKYTELEGNNDQIPIKIVDFNTVDRKEDVFKVMMIDEPEILEKAIKKIPEEVYDKYTVVRSEPYFLEFQNKNSNKGEGIKAVSEYLGIKQKDIICIGDADNDIDMIKFAGLGVAMGNAFDEVKKAADYITSTNEEDGVAYAIERFV